MPHLVLIFRVWIHLCGATHTNHPTSITTEEPKSPPWRRNQRHQHHHQHQSSQPRPPQNKPERSSGRTATPQPQHPFNQRRKEQETETRLVQSIQHFYSYPNRIYTPTSRRGLGGGLLGPIMSVWDRIGYCKIPPHVAGYEIEDNTHRNRRNGKHVRLLQSLLFLPRRGFFFEFAARCCN